MTEITLKIAEPKLPLKHDILKELYYSRRLLMAGIAEKLNCSNHKVVWWMNRRNIKRRSRSEATYIKHNPDGDPFFIKKIQPR
ncbi:MAG: hypothetical protein HY747_05655 [Elusimicrobia bacterium]|nr:hypothetical protein [Elusimicrobiota bacterium]